LNHFIGQTDLVMFADCGTSFFFLLLTFFFYILSSQHHLSCWLIYLGWISASWTNQQ